jgi:CubicO group peptidase (beta-lactamase class C family)
MNIKPFRFLPRKLAFVSTIWTLSSVALAQPLPVATPESVGLSSQRLEKITNTFKQEVAQGKLPGAVVMIARKGKLVYSQAFGKLIRFFASTP